MGMYDGFKDTPNQIRSEGQQIDVAFVRNGDGTGTIKWNIPTPVAGCSAEDQAYDGIVILVSDKPANYIESSPKDSVYYTADPTFDEDLHAADKIDGTRVVGAFYHDKTTHSLTVQDVVEKTPYYVSGYAVDGVARYHREGVHAYSLPTGTLEYTELTDSPAIQDIGLDLPVIQNGTSTGLIGGVEYFFNIVINGVQYKVIIQGQDAPTYPDLIDAINAEFVRLTAAERKNLTLDTSYYFDVATGILYVWDYDKYIEVDVIISDADPVTPVEGAYWYDGTDLYVYNSGAWVQVTLLTLSFDPSDPTCGTVWYDGTDVWRWDNTHWCKLPTYTQSTDPLLPPVMTCDSYWYDEENFALNGWSIDDNGWVEANAIYSETDPNDIAANDFWYDETNLVIMIRGNNEWEDIVNITYSERNAEGDLDTPVASQYWYIPSEQILYQRSPSNSTWVARDFTLSMTDPTDRNSCDLWWNSSSVDDLFTWDELHGVWQLVASFVQSSIDPSLAPELIDNSAWVNPDDGKIKLLTVTDCSYKDVEYISFPTDPTGLPAGVGWLDSDGVFRISDGTSGWTIITPILAPSDPYDYVGNILFWYNPTSELLAQWNGVSWDNIVMTDGLVYPTVGDMFLNDIDEKLYTWDGTTWVETNAIAEVILLNPNFKQVNPNASDPPSNKLRFVTTTLGCKESLGLIIESENLWTLLDTTVVYYDPVDGGSKLERPPTWQELGVGDDGSPDERRELHTIIRNRLGAPSQKVELTDDQIDEALNSALLMIRKYSGHGYHREFFFLDLMPNQQRYSLTNRCVGFHKITGVNYLYRMRSGFLSGNLSAGGYDIYGYAALIHLYKTGTFDMLSYHLVSSYIEDMQIMFADHLTFNWVEDKRQLQLYHIAYDKERVLLDAYVERTEQQLFNDRETRGWIKDWAIAECKIMLSQVRGKFQTLPGPAGSTTLNSQELITQGEAEKAGLEEALYDPAMQNLTEAGQGAHFIVG
jgi:hypothetical protein